MKNGAAPKAVTLRLIVAKPEPDNISPDQEALSRILESGVSFERYYSRDSVGGDRPSETVRYAVVLAGRFSRADLLSYVQKNISAPLNEAHADRIVSALQDAEDAGLVRLKRLRG